MTIPESIGLYLQETLGMEQASVGKHAVDRAIKTLMNREKISRDCRGRNLVFPG
jgi:hypothetical protein